MKSTDVQKVINKLRKISRRPFCKTLNMGVGHVHPCGTTHCHGGWYAIASLGFFKSMGVGINYVTGGNLMANDLGFKDMQTLSSWAGRNPELWGNYEGMCMFSGKMAFYHPQKRPMGAKSIRDIVDHWQEVHDRLKEQEDAELNKMMVDIIMNENAVKLQHKDITKQLSEAPIAQEVLDLEQEPVIDRY